MRRWITLWLAISLLLTAEQALLAQHSLGWLVPHATLLLALLFCTYGRPGRQLACLACLLILRAGESLESVAPDVWLLAGLCGLLDRVRTFLFIDRAITHWTLSLCGALWLLAGHAGLSALGLAGSGVAVTLPFVGRLASAVLVAPLFLRLVHRSRLLRAWLEERPT
ncbi:MAG: hypothetical protein AB1486_30025 [Planctomycetota bacterium]